MRQTPDRLREIASHLKGKMNLRSLIVTLAAIVVFTTTYMLILPAFTLDSQSAAEQGGIDVPAVETTAEETSDSTDSAVADEKAAANDANANANQAEASGETKADQSAEKADAKAKEPDESAAKVKAADPENSDVKLLTGKKTITATQGKGDDFAVSAVVSTDAKVPADVTITATELGKNTDGFDYDQYKDDALAALKKDSSDVKSIKSIKFYDISLESDSQDKSVEPSAPVSVKISYEDGMKVSDADNIRIVHFAEQKNGSEKAQVLDANKNNVETTTAANGSKVTGASFDTDGFSKYAVVEVEIIEKTVITADGKTYKVTVSYDKNAKIPEGSELEVKELTGADYDAYLEKAASKLDKNADDLGMAKFFDITIKNGDDEVKIASPVDVEIKLLDSDKLADSTQVLHFSNEDKADVVDSKVDGDTVKFEAASFSIYAVVGEGEGGAYARMNLHFMNGTTEVAKIIVKNGDTREELEHIIYDPGVGTIPDGTIFKGWSTTPSYTVADAEKGMDIDEVRDWVDTLTVKENEDMYVYAMLYKNFVVNYLDENNVGVGSDNTFILASDTSSPYTVNQAYSPKDDTHAFLGWNVSEGGNYIDGHTEGKLYHNGDNITIKGNVTFSVNAPEGHWLIFDENGKGATYNSPVFIESGDGTQEPTAPTRFGYTFGGWYTEVAGEEDEHGYTPVVESSRYTFGGTINDKTTLYAKWTPVASANYTVIIWKQNVTADGYDFAESITLTGNTGTTVNSVTRQGTGDDAYARISGTNKQYVGFYLNTFDQNVTITPEGDAVLNVYYDRIKYTLRFYYARSYRYNNRTYVQVNVNDEGFLQGKGRRSVKDSLTRVITNDYGFFSGGNTWKDVNANGLNGDATKLITDSYKQKVTLGSEYIGDYNTYVVGTNYTYENNNNATSRSVGMTYYYFDVNVYYGQSVVDVWPVPSEDTYNVYRGSGYNTRSSNDGQPATGIGQQIRPIHQGFYATGNGVSGVYSTVDPEMFVGNSKTAYFITYWRFQSAYQVTYNSYFSALDDETPDVYYHGKGYILHESFTALTGEPWQSSGRATDNGRGWDIGTVTYDGTNYASGYGYVGRVDGQNPNVINAYYDRVVQHIIYNDGTYVDGRNNPIQNRKAQQLHTQDVLFGNDLASYNVDGEHYWRPADTDEYVFEGWYLDSEGQQPYTFTGTMPEHDITVYAKWRQRQYRVFLHPNADHIADLDWGSATQAMSFRVSYGDTISAPTGRSQEWEFVGWYTDPSCSPSSLFATDTVLNEQTVTATYDKTKDLTDPMDKWGNGATRNTDLDRFWITKKYDLYGKWRAKLIGANGIGVVYDLNGGSGNNHDNNLYLDQAQATAQAAATAPEGKQFVKWIVQTWDETENKYVDKKDGSGNLIGAYPGDSFDVLKNDAKYVITGYANPDDPEDIIPTQDATHTEIVATYTVQLRAEYVDSGAGVPTEIKWYGNNETSSTDATEFVVSDEDVMINQAIDVKAANTFTYEGHEFLGWARVPVSDNDGKELDPTFESVISGKNLTLEELGVDDLFLKYVPASGGNPAHYEATGVTVGATSGSTVSKVAPDERYPYHAMVAVWAKKTYDVTILKEVDGTAADKDRYFEIDTASNVSAKDDSGATYDPFKRSFSLRDKTTHVDDKGVVSAVPHNARFSVSEKNASEYDVEYSAKYTDKDGIKQDAPVAPDGSYIIKGNTEITVKNTRKTVDITINKVDEKGGALKGAKFDLYSRDSNPPVKVTTLVDAPNGVIDLTGDASKVIRNVPSGHYRLVETNAPDGYILLDKNVDFEVDAKGSTIIKVDSGSSSIASVDSSDSSKMKIQNKPGTPLPHTGGIGTTIFYILGALLVVGCGIVLISRRRMGSDK